MLDGIEKMLDKAEDLVERSFASGDRVVDSILRLDKEEVKLRCSELSDRVVATRLNENKLSSPFDSLPLDRTSNEIRIWRFRPSTLRQSWRHGARIHLEMKLYSLDGPDHSTCSLYTALSYVWGSADKTTTIRVNAGFLNITENLRDIFRVLMSKPDLKHGRWFWADQVSINQADVNERGHQVSLMSQIYAGATSVYAFLGPALSTEFANPMAFFKAYEVKNFSRSCDSKEWQNISASIDFACRPYWSRLWIMQELYLARDIVFWCGDRDYKRSFTTETTSLIEKYEPTLNTLHWYDKSFEPHVNAIRYYLEKVPHIVQWGRPHNTAASPMTLFSAVKLGAGSSCSDPRDKIFGVQAMVFPDSRIAIDYTQSYHDIVKKMARAIIAHGEEGLNYEGQVLFDQRDMFTTGLMSKVAGNDFTVITRSLIWSARMARLLRVYDGLPKDLKCMGSVVVNSPHVEQRAVINDIQRHKGDPCLHDLASAAHRRGFVMYGGFLARPDEWHFPDETPTFLEHLSSPCPAKRVVHWNKTYCCDVSDPDCSCAAHIVARIKANSSRRKYR